MTKARLLVSILPVAGFLALAAMPAQSETAGHLLHLGESLDRVPDRAVSGYRADVDLRELDFAERLELELPGGRFAELERTRLERRADGDLLWTGRTDLGEEVVLTVVGGRLAGTFFSSESGYQIQPHGEGGHILLEADPGAPPGCGGAPLLGPSEEGAEFQARIRASDSSEAVHRTPRIDVLLVYASDSTAAVGSKRNMATIIQHFVDLTNVAFHNSEMEVRIRLVHAAEVVLPAGLPEDSTTTLQWVASSAAISNLRATHGADFTGLIWEGSGNCGEAGMIYRPGGPTLSHAFFVTRRTCGADIFAHEVGHLLGADHNPEAANIATGRYLYGRAHYHNGHYRTLVSRSANCDLGCLAQPFFSNPNVTYAQRATGIRDERDNARIIDEFAAQIERFSPSIDGAACELAPGDPDYCLECGPCVAGEGNCETDSECDSRLICDPDGGPDFGLAIGVGVCRAPVGCELEPGDPDYCRQCGPCSVGDGDCDQDRECQAGLNCVDDIGASFGLPESVDVCAYRTRGFWCAGDAPFPSLGDPNYCEVCGPCRLGEGNCKSTSECQFGVTCFPDVGGELGFPSGTNVCLLAPPSECGLPPGHAFYCKECGVCDVGEGDCDGDRECRDGLTCVDGGGFGVDGAIDVCLEVIQPPKRLKARAVRSSRVRLKWKDKSSNEDGFHVEMSADGGRFERIASTGANAKKLFVADLESGTTYIFRVQAFNVDGTSPYSNQRSVTLP